MSQPEVVENGNVVIIRYTLRDSKGEILDSTDEGEPMPYLHGAQNIVPGLEKMLTGKSVGDTFTTVVAAEEGYGPRHDFPVQSVGLDQFGDMELEEGMMLFTEIDEGQVVPFWISKIGAKDVQIDLNHPLAGEELHFDIEVLGIRTATEEELDHGHPHGLDGTQGH